MAKGYGVVVNIETAARILKMSKSTAYEQVQAGTMPGLLPASDKGCRRVSVGALEQYLSLHPGMLVGDIDVVMVSGGEELDG